MPPYVWKTRQIDGHDLSFDWTIATSCFDFDYRWISIRGAKIGHLHFHVNSWAGRVQAWIFETQGSGWEEYFITGRMRDSMTKLDIDNLVNLPVWTKLVLNARRDVGKQSLHGCRSSCY
jgi:hypothetical protein